MSRQVDQSHYVLSEEQLAEIDAFLALRPETVLHTRARAIRLLHEEKSVKAAAHVLGKHPGTIRNWHSLWRQSERGLRALARSKEEIAICDLFLRWSELAHKLDSIQREHEKALQSLQELEQEARRLQRMIGERDQELQRAKHDAIRDLFSGLLATQGGPHALLKLLEEGDDRPLWLAALARYLRDEVGLRIVDEKDRRLLLTEENCDAYQLNEQVTLPHEVRIASRGIALGNDILKRPEVTTYLKE